MTIRQLVLVLAVGAAIAGCGKSDDQGATPGATPTVATGGPSDGRALFAQRCGPCHGTSGRGDGPAAAALDPKPRDYTDRAWQASVTDEAIRKIIVGGGAAVGKSPSMPPNPDLEGSPMLDEVVSVVRSYGN